MAAKVIARIVFFISILHRFPLAALTGRVCLRDMTAQKGAAAPGGGRKSDIFVEDLSGILR